MTDLPTPAEMLADADRHLARITTALNDTAAVLRSQWPPGWFMTDEEVERQMAMFRAIHTCLSAINQARNP